MLCDVVSCCLVCSKMLCDVVSCCLVCSKMLCDVVSCCLVCSKLLCDVVSCCLVCSKIGYGLINIIKLCCTFVGILWIQGKIIVFKYKKRKWKNILRYKLLERGVSWERNVQRKLYLDKQRNSKYFPNAARHEWFDVVHCVACWVLFWGNILAMITAVYWIIYIYIYAQILIWSNFLLDYHYKVYITCGFVLVLNLMQSVLLPFI
jgi:hypothetical protein